MLTFQSNLKRLRKRDKKAVLKVKNPKRRLWLLIYSNIRNTKGLKPDNTYLTYLPLTRKFAVIANRIYIRR